MKNQIQELLTILKWTSIAATASAIFFTIVMMILEYRPIEWLDTDIALMFVFFFLVMLATYISVVLLTRAFPRRKARKKKSE